MLRPGNKTSFQASTKFFTSCKSKEVRASHAAVMLFYDFCSRLGAKGASDIGANPFHGGKKVPAAPPANKPRKSSLYILPDPRGSKFSFRHSLHEVQQFELCAGETVWVITASLSSRRWNWHALWIAAPHKTSSVYGSAFRRLRNRSSSCWSTAGFLSGGSSLRFLKHSF